MRVSACKIETEKNMENTLKNGFKLTKNAGFDALRKKTYAISKNMGYNTAEKIGLLKKHVLISQMLKNKDIKINKIGVNICLFIRYGHNCNYIYDIHIITYANNTTF